MHCTPRPAHGGAHATAALAPSGALTHAGRVPPALEAARARSVLPSVLLSILPGARPAAPRLSIFGQVAPGAAARAAPHGARVRVAQRGGQRAAAQPGGRHRVERRAELLDLRVSRRAWAAGVRAGCCQARSWRLRSSMRPSAGASSTAQRAGSGAPRLDVDYSPVAHVVGEPRCQLTIIDKLPAHLDVHQRAVAHVVGEPQALARQAQRVAQPRRRRLALRLRGRAGGRLQDVGCGLRAGGRSRLTAAGTKHRHGWTEQRPQPATPPSRTRAWRGQGPAAGAARREKVDRWPQPQSSHSASMRRRRSLNVACGAASTVRRNSCGRAGGRGGRIRTGETVSMGGSAAEGSERRARQGSQAKPRLRRGQVQHQHAVVRRRCPARPAGRASRRRR